MARCDTDEHAHRRDAEALRRPGATATTGRTGSSTEDFNEMKQAGYLTCAVPR